MAIPLTPSPPKPLRAQNKSKAGVRGALSAGVIALAATAVVATTPGVALAQDDVLLQENAWAIDLIQAPAAQATATGEGITVAVLDTGISEHPFFEDKDILPGMSLFSDEEDAWNDTHIHGSAVAAAVLMVAPEATILPIRIDSGDSTFGGAMGEKEFEAFRWAVDNGADVLVTPWILEGQRSAFDGEYLETLQYVIDKGAIIVAGAGNDPDIEVGYPAFVPGVVAVTGTDSSGEVWYENTTTGPEIALAAPADTMTVPLSQDSATGNTELYTEVGGGTSMGSGLVGGVAALTWDAHPDLDASNVIQRMIQTAGDGNGERSEDAGYGLVNADRAVNAEGIETVDANPLGYPMGEAGASGATTDDEGEASAGASQPEPGSAGPSGTAADGNKESNLSTLIVVAAAVVLIGAAVAVWLVLRGRSRKSVAAPHPGEFNAAPPGGYQQQPVPTHQQYGGPPQGGQPGYGAPPPQGYSSPPRSQQGFNAPPSAGEPQSPPWRPSDPNRQ